MGAGAACTSSLPHVGGNVSHAVTDRPKTGASHVGGNVSRTSMVDGSSNWPWRTVKAPDPRGAMAAAGGNVLAGGNVTELEHERAALERAVAAQRAAAETAAAERAAAEMEVSTEQRVGGQGGGKAAAEGDGLRRMAGSAGRVEEGAMVAHRRWVEAHEVGGHGLPPTGHGPPPTSIGLPLIGENGLPLTSNALRLAHEREALRRAQGSYATKRAGEMLSAQRIDTLERAAQDRVASEGRSARVRALEGSDECEAAADMPMVPARPHLHSHPSPSPVTLHPHPSPSPFTPHPSPLTPHPSPLARV